MPTISCINCSKQFYLAGFTYWNFTGDVKCPNCGSLHTISLESGELRNIILKTHQTLSVIQAPLEITKDINEALTCHSVQAFRACVVMCRRALEQMCTDLNAQGGSLYQKIEYLSNNGIISIGEFNIFSEIRFFGNYGAHPSNDLLNGVTNIDSNLVLEATLHMIKHIYEIPEKLKQLRARRGLM